jgi:hypothetical protein
MEGPTRARPLPTVVRYAKVRLTVTRGPDTGLTFETAGVPVRIGTSSDNDIVLSDDTVSRRHAEMEPTPLGMRVRDVESTNGLVIGAFASVTRPSPAISSRPGPDLDFGTVARRDHRPRAGRGRPSATCSGARRGCASCSPIWSGLRQPTSRLLIEGETGTGGSDRGISTRQQAGERAVRRLDCGAAAPTVIESELFGHERGAFTGAHGTPIGVFEQAHGGTLFLDEWASYRSTCSRSCCA